MRARFLSPYTLLLSAITLLAVGGPAAAQGPVQFQVTITNLTAGQTFTPIVVASHKAGIRLFDLGQPASVPLEHLAEGGETAPLEMMLQGTPGVKQVIDSGAPLPPGQSVTLMVAGGLAFDHVSVASMLVPTNDGFFAVNDAAIPLLSGTRTIYSPAYDAGTEANDEMCAHIPGPPNICTGEGFNATRDDVNFVHIHPGIHGIGNLPNPAGLDWRNPVAKILIRRVR